MFPEIRRFSDRVCVQYALGFLSIEIMCYFVFREESALIVTLKTLLYVREISLCLQFLTEEGAFITFYLEKQ